ERLLLGHRVGQEVLRQELMGGADLGRQRPARLDAVGRSLQGLDVWQELLMLVPQWLGNDRQLWSSSPSGPGPPSRSGAGRFLNCLLQDDGVIVPNVLSSEDQGHRLVLRLAGQPREHARGLWSAQFFLVTLAELLPAGRVVAEPAPQLSAGRQLLQPRVQAQVLAPDAARPQAVDQVALAVGRRRWFVSSLEVDCHR